MTDTFKKYLLTDNSTRIQAVRLQSAWQTGLAHQSYPECIRSLLGELTAAAILLATNIKFQGSVVLQLQGDGPVSLIVVECTSELTFRATVSLRDPELVPAKGTLQTLLNGTGSGRFTVLLDPGRDTDMAPYQGIVPMEGDTVAEVLEAYMRNSEQLDTRLWLAADGDTVAGMLLQRLPDAGGIRPTHGGTPNAPDSTPESRAESWNRVTQLASTLTQPELLQADIDTIIHRLFWQEPLLQLETRRVQWHCPCTRTRVGNMLRMLGRDEIESLLQEREHITVSCNFCGKPYEFDAVDCAALFVENLDDSGSRTLH
ncbi:Hsp33 family molecular chaperone HslO [Yanghanlia caeni]|uniref:Hsp33 family molecular chaperone HslO n=1 Tax=Yanghanlia caeni TaxID=3064283 RepID=A0ABU1D3W9_9BURK|nr:Hsp33 family molecular chaperone HslO [Alcaligenaceae bacterium LG-2]NGR07483.1 Hsp33 family molecular chaperone HslO [bacterium SGD-2]HZH55725.1 Hsp33 family molecular chaperone HslO [Burkholderiaceae bacterium]